MSFYTFFYSALTMQKAYICLWFQKFFEERICWKNWNNNKAVFQTRRPCISHGDHWWPASIRKWITVGSQGANLTADWEHKHWFDVASSQCDDGFPEGFLLIRWGGIIISETEKVRTFFKLFFDTWHRQWEQKHWFSRRRILVSHSWCCVHCGLDLSQVFIMGC